MRTYQGVFSMISTVYGITTCRSAQFKTQGWGVSFLWQDLFSNCFVLLGNFITAWARNIISIRAFYLCQGFWKILFPFIFFTSCTKNRFWRIFSSRISFNLLAYWAWKENWTYNYWKCIQMLVSSHKINKGSNLPSNVGIWPTSWAPNHVEIM